MRSCSWNRNRATEVAQLASPWGPCTQKLRTSRRRRRLATGTFSRSAISFPGSRRLSPLQRVSPAEASVAAYSPPACVCVCVWLLLRRSKPTAQRTQGRIVGRCRWIGSTMRRFADNYHVCRAGNLVGWIGAVTAKIRSHSMHDCSHTFTSKLKQFCVFALCVYCRDCRIENMPRGPVSVVSHKGGRRLIEFS